MIKVQKNVRTPSQAFYPLKQCRWRLQNVQKWHEKTALKVAEGMHKQYNGNMMSKPQAVVKAVNARRPKPCYLIGFGAKPLVFAHARIRLYYDARFLN